MRTYSFPRFAAAIALISSLLAVSVPAQEPSHPEVSLPSEGHNPAYERLLQDAQHRYGDQAAWRDFRAAHGDWRATWGLWTGAPVRVIGEGYQIPGAGRVDAQNVERLARTFVATFEHLLKTKDMDLELVDAHPYLDKWTVSFRQMHRGVPVELSEVTLRMTGTGRVFLFGSDVFPGITVSTVPMIPEQDAAVLAMTGLIPPAGGAIGVSTGRLAVLPIRGLSGLTTPLAWNFLVTENDEHVWETWVDASSGAILWRRNTVCQGISGVVQASVKTSSVTQAESVVNLFDQHMVVNGVTTVTDRNGTYASSGSGQVTVMLRGPYARIERQDGTNATITQTVANNTTFNVLWNSSNSTLAERTTFYNVVRARRFILDMDTTITALDYQMPCRVGVNAVCNANFDGTNLNFYRSGTTTSGTCPATGEMPDVVMHEYGHAVNEKSYVQFGVAAGMVNGALHEGLADVNAAMILDRSEIGVGFFGANTVLRNTNNTNKYPDDIVNQVHTDGLILGGAVWDMRLGIGIAQSRLITHFARHGKPDDTNTGLAFTKYFLEVLAADDNDGNLVNGTPNASQIVPAFAKHGIPSGMLSITHTPVGSVAGGTPIPMSADVTTALAEITAQSVLVKYRLRGQSTWSTATLTLSAGNQAATSTWSGSLPGQLNGSIVEYYIEATEVWGTSKSYPAAGASAPLLLLVGFSTHTLLDCESASGWQAHITGDNATTGRWINAVPVGTSVNGIAVQTAADHSPLGTRCWVTGNGAANGQPGDADVDGGKTTLITPVLLTAGLNVPVLRYYAWYSNDMGASPGIDPWVVQISSNGGTSWVTLENTDLSFNRWTERVFVLSDYITPTNSVLVRFVARDDDPGSLVEAAVDDVEILHVQQVPVDLVSFTARRDGPRVRAEWRTASERNNAGFTVEYRMDASEAWTVGAFIPGQGTSMANQSYAATFDLDPTRAAVVRLVQMDLDGTVTLSPEVHLAAQPRGFALEGNFPNPFAATTTVEFVLGDEREVRLLVTDLLGRIVQDLELGSLQAGVHRRKIDLGAATPGTYTCTVVAGLERSSRVLHVSR